MKHSASVELLSSLSHLYLLPIVFFQRNMAKSSSTRMALWAILIAASPLLASSADVNYGLQMLGKAGSGACWIEKLNKLPTVEITDQNEYWQNCEANLGFEHLKAGWDLVYQNYAGQMQGASEEEITAEAIGNQKLNMKDGFQFLPSDYRASCEKYMDNENQAPSKDFSPSLKDSSNAYPFKGLAHCMLEVAERRNGKQEMAALKSRWTSPKSFRQAIIDRENENRARHNTPPLTLDSTLNAQAQKWADKLAAANYCKSTHEKIFNENSTNIKYHGESTGENLHSTGYTAGEDIDIGVDGANGWYTEISNYPWPAYNGYKKGTIGHFTQSVWKSSKLAGYGIGRSQGCNNVFVVARYYPAGNQMWYASDPYMKYRENVLPKNY